MKNFKKSLRHHWILMVILCFGAFLGLYQLNNLPAEMWGDATAHYALAQQVRHGLLFFNYRYGGDGPIYTYFVVFVSWFLGLSFYTLKFTSVFVYLLFIFFMYLLSEALFKKKEITYITSFLSAVSFWSITFARQPHARMLVPLFITATVFFAVKKKNKVSGILLGLGMYTQASFWAMPLMFWRQYKILLIGILITIPLVIMFTSGGVGFFTNQSYFGEKLAVTDNYSPSQVIENFESNISANFFAFFLRGDEGFRLNVPDSPQLDTVSAIFFFIGYILLIKQSIKKKQMKYVEFILLPFLLIQIPSLLDIHNPQAQPNIGRMIGVIPFVYITTAYGLTNTFHFVTAKTIRDPRDESVKKVFYSICIFYLLLVIAVANMYKYFIIYPYYLPDHNTPFARIIAHTIDRYPQNIIVDVIGSGWSEWGQPEQQAIIDSTTAPHTINFLQNNTPVNTLCSIIQTNHNPVIFITSPTDVNSFSSIKSCRKSFSTYLLQTNFFQVARVTEIK